MNDSKLVAAWDAVWKSGWLDPTAPETNAKIWRCVEAALNAYEQEAKCHPAE